MNTLDGLYRKLLKYYVVLITDLSICPWSNSLDLLIGKLSWNQYTHNKCMALCMFCSPDFLFSPVKDTIVVNDRWGKGTHCTHGDYFTCVDRYHPSKHVFVL